MTTNQQAKHTLPTNQQFKISKILVKMLHSTVKMEELHAYKEEAWQSHEFETREKQARVPEASEASRPSHTQAPPRDLFRPRIMEYPTI